MIGMLLNLRPSRFSILLIFYFSFSREGRGEGPLNSIMNSFDQERHESNMIFPLNAVGAGTGSPAPQRTNKGLLLYHIIRFGEQGLVGVLAPF